MSASVVFTLFYVLVSICLIYPPSEFIAAGVTIPKIFASSLGSENEQFIQYHIKRVQYTITTNAILPVIYIIGLWYVDDTVYSETFFMNASYFWQLFVIIAIALPVVVIYKFYKWEKRGWIEHPICKNLKPFCSPRETWVSVASGINREFRGIEKFSMEINSVMKFVATENWIMKITPYTIYFAHQRDTAMILDKSDTHNLSHITGGDVQYINISVKPVRTGSKPFTIRLNALDFKELQDRINRPITILPNVRFHKTILERFIDTFKQEIALNVTYIFTQPLDLCMGCMQQISNVKLQRLCHNETGNLGEVVSPDECMSCHCRPLWCADCMALWFASRQNKNQTDNWLSKKCTCPVCRAKFCILDVSYVDTGLPMQ